MLVFPTLTPKITLFNNIACNW